MIPVQALFEAHLMVADLDRAITFYRDVLDFRLATVLPERGVAFFWIGPGSQSMLGLWTGGGAPLRMNLHTAFRTQRDHVLAAPQRLRNHGIEPLNLQGRPTNEPVVIGWMPAVAIYFRDPDDNLLEYIAMLDEPPRPEAGVVHWSEWQQPQSGIDPD